VDTRRRLPHLQTGAITAGWGLEHAGILFASKSLTVYFMLNYYYLTFAINRIFRYYFFSFMRNTASELLRRETIAGSIIKNPAVPQIFPTLREFNASRRPGNHMSNAEVVFYYFSPERLPKKFFFYHYLSSVSSIFFNTPQLLYSRASFLTATPLLLET
jgi:hypothetical protein